MKQAWPGRAQVHGDGELDVLTLFGKAPTATRVPPKRTLQEFMRMGLPIH